MKSLNVRYRKVAARTGFWLAWFVFLMQPEVGPLFAQEISLWDRRDERNAFLFRDTNARSIGDVLTVVISENTGVESSEQRDLNKETGSSQSGGFSFGGFGSSGSGTASAESESNREFSGNSTFTSDRRFLDRISVTVTDVLPNGNLVIVGSRKVFVEGDEKTLRVSGIVRGLDIRSDNSVRSSNISGLEIAYQGSGPDHSFTKRGWLSRKLDKLWPY